jgi:predicted phage terminase large subunit-like protein
VFSVEDIDHVARDGQRQAAESHLIDFIELMWPVVEPGRPFVRGWAIEAICQHLEAVTEGRIRRLLINVPPGFMKSLATCVFWPAWEWIRNPSLRYIFASYVGSLSLINNTKLRRLVESDVYQQFWGSSVTLTDDQNAKTYFETTMTGFAMATSVGGAVMGKRGDRVILDDPNNTKDTNSDAMIEEALQFLTEVLPTRINDEKTFAQVTIMQRTGERDVAGHLLDHKLIDGHLCIPMEWRTGHPHIAYAHRPTSIGWADPRTAEGELAFEQRYSRAGVEDLKKQLSSWGGDYAIAGQLDQLPIPRGGGMFQEEWFDRVVDESEVPAGGVTVRSWDPAGSKGKNSPFTASVKQRLVRDTLYIFDVTNERIDAAELEEYVARVSLEDDPSTIIDFPQDPGQAGKAQVSSLARRLHGRTYVYSPESGSKETRAMPFASQCKAKNVVLVRGPWNRTFVMQAKSFPRGMFKDIVDAASRGYAQIVKRTRRVQAVDGGWLGVA